MISTGGRRLAPDSDELLFWAGLSIAEAGDLEAGAAAVRRAAQVHPGWLACSTGSPRSSPPPESRSGQAGGRLRSADPLEIGTSPQRSGR